MDYSNITLQVAGVTEQHQDIPQTLATQSLTYADLFEARFFRETSKLSLRQALGLVDPAIRDIIRSQLP
ncbi:MAG: hypothetical protein GX221_11360 [Candidatus Riflebacteria bacterium]|nr:hypothetical protein [Candidatus Riflebacteria bacterium]